ncbi:MAG: hypothetical protein ABSE49_13690 [Polyangiaceae bacterium]|jgi:hypothetical protein
MHRARRGFAAAALVLAASSTTTTARAADKVRCAAAYEQSQELRRQDKLSASRAQLLICGQACPKALAADCTKWQAEVEALMPTVRLRARDAQGQPTEARVFVDGALLLEHLVDAPVPVDSGDHTFRFESPDGVTADVHVALHGGEPAREIEAVLAPAPVAVVAPATRGLVPVSAYVLGAMGAAGLALGGGLSLAGHLDAGHLRSTCAPGCAPDRVDSIATLYDVAWVSAGVGVASLAVALALWKPWQSAAARPAAGALFVVPTLGGAMVGWTLR